MATVKAGVTEIDIAVSKKKIVCPPKTHVRVDDEVYWKCQDGRWKVTFDDGSPFRALSTAM